MAKQQNQTPRISVNKLAEFTTAKAGRQRQILRDQKYPTEYKGMFHKEAAEAIAVCIASGLEDIGVVERRISILDQMAPEKVGAQRRINANIDALESFLQMLDDIDFAGGVPSLGAHTQAKQVVHNVEISVRPEIMMTGKGKTGALVGAMKLHFPTTFPLNTETAGYVSAVVQQWVQDHEAGSAKVWGPYCSVLDIGSRTFYPGVKATSARMKDIAACCQNIFGLWPTITPDG